MEKGKKLIFRTSRISYIHNYLLIILLLITVFLIYPHINFDIWWHVLILFGTIIIILFLLEEPELEIWFKRYVITDTEVIKIEGILTKKKTTIPYQSVADVKVIKGVVGRLLNFGTVHVGGFKAEDEVEMNGVKNPEEIYNIVQNKLSSSRAFHPRVSRRHPEEKG